MCGLLGLVTAAQLEHPDTPRRFATALASLHHRGPDARGVYEHANVRLGHVRLSILDLSAAGNQPMQSPDGRFAISYNGEVYNFRELAQQHGIVNLRTGTDTEVVLRLFERYGIDALAKLNGMFAFAVYDTRARKLWLARDRLGIKPLYYRCDEDGLAFASEIKAITALGSTAPRCDVGVLHEWLYYGNPMGSHTLHFGIRQLLPGHYLEFDVDRLQAVVGEYWSLKQQAGAAMPRAERTHGVIATTRQLLEQAVKRQLVADVPVGVFLSGGVDSTAITAFASRHYAGRLATYSAGFDFARDGGELPKAKRIAARFGTEHHEIHVSGAEVSDLVERMVRHHDMPFSDAANIPLFLLASRISGQIKVVLQGDGGDELFGGYRRYSTLQYYPLLRPLARLLRPLHRRAPHYALRSRVQRYLNALAAEDLATTTALLLTAEDREWTPQAIFASGPRAVLEKADPFARHRECQRMFSDHDIGNQMSFVDLVTTLPDTFLEKVDRSTMAASLEVRVPFLDHDLVDYVVRLPGRCKMPWGRKKWLLKAALEGCVPAEVLHGPKVGLTVPIREWLQGALKPMFFDQLSSFARQHPQVLDLDYVNRLFAETAARTSDHSRMLWKVLNLSVWANTSKIEINDSVVD